MYENILIEGDAVVTVTLNRPDIHNPFDERTISELTDCFLKLQKRETLRAVVITGAGKSFCAGADLNWMKRMADYSHEENLADAELLSDMFAALEGIPVPTIAKVNGAAFGGGAGLACACDFAIANERAKIGFSEVKLGLLPGVVSFYVLERVGKKAGIRLFTSGERLDAQRALAVGLVDYVVPQERLDAAVEELVNQILTGGPNAVKACKGLALARDSRTREEFKRYCIEAIAAARASEEGKEGVSAFLEKRKPAWRSDLED